MLLFILIQNSWIRLFDALVMFEFDNDFTMLRMITAIHNFT